MASRFDRPADGYPCHIRQLQFIIPALACSANCEISIIPVQVTPKQATLCNVFVSTAKD
jgi:hypothetical protein